MYSVRHRGAAVIPGTSIATLHTSTHIHQLPSSLATADWHTRLLVAPFRDGLPP
jgi:hypothetical protein